MRKTGAATRLNKGLAARGVERASAGEGGCWERPTGLREGEDRLGDTAPTPRRLGEVGG